MSAQRRQEITELLAQCADLAVRAEFSNALTALMIARAARAAARR